MMVKSAVTLLAGGQARRMGGGDKNLMMLAGKPILQHVLDRVDFDGRPVMINANGDPSRYAEFGLPVRADVIDGFAGPLAGILTGLEWVAADHPECTHMISLATDAPFLPFDLIAGLEEGLTPELTRGLPLHKRCRLPDGILFSRSGRWPLLQCCAMR